MTGVRKNVVVAVEIHGRDGNDSPLLPALLDKTTANGFNVTELPADKGHISVDNRNAITAAGATPHLPFKSNATGASGGLWERYVSFIQFSPIRLLKALPRNR